MGMGEYVVGMGGYKVSMWWVWVGMGGYGWVWGEYGVGMGGYG